MKENNIGQFSSAFSHLRPITPEDVIIESDRSYNMGRRHGHEERADLLDWAETLLCKSMPMPNCSQEDWNLKVKTWLDEKHSVDLAPRNSNHLSNKK